MVIAANLRARSDTTDHVSPALRNVSKTTLLSHRLGPPKYKCTLIFLDGELVKALIIGKYSKSWVQNSWEDMRPCPQHAKWREAWRIAFQLAAGDVISSVYVEYQGMNVLDD
jgi:hypothetical protein